MGRKRRTFAASFKASVALAALKGEQTISELAGRYEVHATLISLWKKQLVEGVESIFSGEFKAADVQSELRKAELFEQIGRLQMELAWLKKSFPFRLRASGSCSTGAIPGSAFAVSASCWGSAARGVTTSRRGSPPRAWR